MAEFRLSDMIPAEQQRNAAKAIITMATAIETWDEIDAEARKQLIRDALLSITEIDAAAAQRLGLLLKLNNTDFDLSKFLDVESLRALGDLLMGAMAFLRRVLSLTGEAQQELLDQFTLPFTGEDAPNAAMNAALLGYEDGTNPLARSRRPSDNSGGSSAASGATESRDADTSDGDTPA